MKALLVDDQGLVREGLALKLKITNPDLEVLTCGEIDEARRLIKEQRPELVFLDVCMAGDRRAGLHLLEELKEADCPSRIVMLTAEDDHATIGSAISTGAVGFVSKNDQDLSAMQRAIELILQGGVYISTNRGQPRPAPTHSPWAAEAYTKVKEVGPEDLRITAPRVYEVLWHISNGIKGYKRVAKVMGISEKTAEGYARDGYNSLNVQGKDAFLVLLTQKAWKLQTPQHLTDITPA